MLFQSHLCWWLLGGILQVGTLWQHVLAPACSWATGLPPAPAVNHTYTAMRNPGCLNIVKQRAQRLLPGGLLQCGSPQMHAIHWFCCLVKCLPRHGTHALNIAGMQGLLVVGHRMIGGIVYGSYKMMLGFGLFCGGNERCAACSQPPASGGATHAIAQSHSQGWMPT